MIEILILKILKWDKNENIYVKINKETLKYARSMIAASCVSAKHSIDSSKIINTLGEPLNFKELTEIMLDINRDNKYTDGPAVELAIAFTKEYNKNISKTRSTNTQGFTKFNTLELVEYITVIEHINAKEKVHNIDGDSPEAISRRIMDKPFDPSPSWYIKPQ